MSIGYDTSSQNGEVLQETMKYYVYVSSTKVDMLFGQSRPALLNTIKLGMKLKIAWGEISAEREKLNEEIYGKVERICHTLRKQDLVGSIENPKAYVGGVANLSYGEICEYASSLALFGGVVNSKKVALIGDSSSLIGGTPREHVDHRPYYYTLRFMNSVLTSERSFSGTETIPYASSLEEAIDIGLNALKTPPRSVEFVAKTLHDTPSLLVATPIYVADV